MLLLECPYSNLIVSTDYCDNCPNKALCLMDNYNIYIEEDNTTSMEKLIEISEDLSL